MPQNDSFRETATLDDPHPAMDMTIESNDSELNESELETGAGVCCQRGNMNHNQAIAAEDHRAATAKPMAAVSDELDESDLETSADGGLWDWMGSPNHNQSLVADDPHPAPADPTESEDEQLSETDLEDVAGRTVPGQLRNHNQNVCADLTLPTE